MNDYSETLSKIADFAKTFNYEERKAERLNDLYAEIKEVHEICPQLRFGQLISCVLGDRDPFYIEDDEMIRLFRDYAKSVKFHKNLRNLVATGQMESEEYTKLACRILDDEITTDEAIKRIKENYHERD